jgi:putative aminopeptidase FrvX
MLSNKNSVKFLKQYLKAFSPTGLETEGQNLWIQRLAKYSDEVHTDSYGTSYAVIKGEPTSKERKVVIEAHADEISWMVNYIDDNGYIYVIRNGGSDDQIAPSKRITFLTDDGEVNGLFGWPAIHTRYDSEIVPETKNLFVDVGASSKDEVLQMGIEVGTIACYPDSMEILNKEYIVSRALDNRIGGFMIAEVAIKLKENEIKLPFDLYVVNSVQEEIGLNGAKMIADTIKPDIAIVTDVTHDTSTPHLDPKKHGDVKCGKGPAISIGPQIHKSLVNKIRKVAHANAIPYQLMAASRGTGTDTDAFFLSNGGTPSSLISLPLKYMHTTVETVSSKDVEACIDLIYLTLTNLESIFKDI